MNINRALSPLLLMLACISSGSQAWAGDVDVLVQCRMEGPVYPGVLSLSNDFSQWRLEQSDHEYSLKGSGKLAFNGLQYDLLIAASPVHKVISSPTTFNDIAGYDGGGTIMEPGNIFLTGSALQASTQFAVLFGSWIRNGKLTQRGSIWVDGSTENCTFGPKARN